MKTGNRNIQSITRGETVVLRLAGDSCKDNARSLRTRLLNEIENAGTVIVDFTGVDKCDSSVIACLVEGLQVARRRGTAFCLASLNARAERMLELFRLRPLFPVVRRPFCA